ncbi:hypothetical protein BBK36DRAFT_1118164 [Trichoderma citrinoviride]|uniref:Amidoligase enzyme n=1 Tax=Trichoderma citrinoviride TaxID=58853 RepID=A0A2T4BC35_9HYPO|nr:hypothetical protein BBK36DRAFT_1118164 [Trichoderma citrinoviride]PTB66887.1 hypothetical protein BBK36DRAFT_1118164 [Trichoderma citrinoviride]
MSTSSHEITLGWELELIVHLQPGEQSGIALEAHKLRDLALTIAEQCPNLPIAAHCIHRPSVSCIICEDAPAEHRLPHVRVFNPATPIRRPNGPIEDLYYFVEREWLRVPTDDNGDRLAHGFEITSPILSHAELRAGLPQTKQILSAVRNSGLTISAHTECGLHFHVGVKSGMTLNIAKKAATLVMLLEMSLLKKLVSEERSEERRWFIPISTRSKFNTLADRMCDDQLTDANTSPEMRQHLPDLSKEKPAEWNSNEPNRLHLALNELWLTDSIWKLSMGLETDRGQKASLVLCTRERNGDSASEPVHGVSDNLEGTPSTIEFRYPAASFDIDSFVCWKDLCCRIVEIATRDSAAYRQVTTDVLRESETNDTPLWERQLKVLGLDYQVPSWRQQLARFDEDGPIRFLDDDGFLIPEKK